MTGLAGLLARDLRLALRQRADAATVILFFALTASLFPFALGTDLVLLSQVAPGILWVTALLAVLLSLERLFLADFEDGSLDQLILSPLPLELAVLGNGILVPGGGRRRPLPVLPERRGDGNRGRLPGRHLLGQRRRHLDRRTPVLAGHDQDPPSGLPEMTGVALGLDRLLMLTMDVNDIQEILL